MQMLSGSLFQLNREKQIIRRLTDEERSFVDHRYHETVASEVGPATEWMVENGVQPHMFLPFYYARSEELSGSEPAKPDRFVVPWKAKEDFLRRAEALEQNQHEE